MVDIITSNMKIKIEYLLKGEKSWKEKHFTPEEFFDSLDDDEKSEGFVVNSIY